MPAFGKNGMVNINQSVPKKVWKLVKPDGTVVASGENRGDVESQKQNLSQSMNCELQLIESTLECL